MLASYLHKFRLPNNRQVFVPSPSARRYGDLTQRWVARRWRAPEHFYHIGRRGGHVAAARRHLNSSIFARLDISGFYDSVTRSKVHRALKSIGFDHGTAWEIARESTVEKTFRARDFSVPYGFTQSPILASVALDRSALGSEMRTVTRSRIVKLSTYMDDVLLSSDDATAINDARERLLEAAGRSGFEINLHKAQGPAPAVTVFNLELAHKSLTVTEERVAEFEAEIAKSDLSVSSAIVAYVRTVNDAQAEALMAAIAVAAALATTP